MTIYIHIPKEKRTKLEPSGKKGTFMGYRVSHMEIDSEEQKALKDDRTVPLVQLFTLQIIRKSQ
jgi:hypothetical protein